MAERIILNKIYQIIAAFSVMLLICSSTLSAQDEEAFDEPTNSFFSFGTYFSLKAGVNGANIPDGRKNAVSFNGVPDFGAICYIPISGYSPLGITVDLSYSTYTFNIKGAIVDREFKNRFSYISICPSLYFSSVMLGFNFGIPVHADYDANIDIDKLNIISEVTLSTMINLKSTDTGDLYFFGRAGYLLNGLFKDYPKDDPLKSWIPPTPPEVLTNKHNPRPVSIALGIAYLFKVSRVF